MKRKRPPGLPPGPRATPYSSFGSSLANAVFILHEVTEIRPTQKKEAETYSPELTLCQNTISVRKHNEQLKGSSKGEVLPVECKQWELIT